MSVEHEELSEQLTARNEGVNILSKVSPPLCVKDGLPVKSNIKGQGYQMPISTAITFMADYYNER